MQHLSPVQVAPLQAHDEHFGGSQVGGNGHIVLVTMADGFDHLAVIPGFGGVGIGKQQNQVNFVIGNAGIDLLVTALLMGKQQSDGQTGIVRNEAAGGGSGKQGVLHQNALVGSAELNHQFLLFVVGQKCDIHSTHSLKIYV